MSTILAGIFAKRPRAGEVKTRLAPVLGLKGAAEFARALLDDAVARLSTIDSRVRAELVFAPAEERAWFAANYPGIALRPQAGEGLAERLEAWFKDVLGTSQQATFAAAVGSDSPWTTRARVARAAELLDEGADVVLGPDMGGGYYLVALRAPVPGLFTKIEMSTRSMFEETCALIEARGLTLALLETDYDVDDEADWRRLVGDLDARRSGSLEAQNVASFVARFEEGRA